MRNYQARSKYEREAKGEEANDEEADGMGGRQKFRFDSGELLYHIRVNIFP